MHREPASTPATPVYGEWETRIAPGSPDLPRPAGAQPPSPETCDPGGAVPASCLPLIDQTLPTSCGPACLAPRLGPAGYEVLQELGRGGMGVVYKARQVRLDRIVALKMILHADHAGQEGLRRFQAEAEAVAQLQHPHIVQIYEVGVCDGLPFFSLEYVEGGTLADHIAHTPQEPRHAAHLVRQLAEAVECAHRKGIIHRDLKPANVLLAFSREPLASAPGALARGSRLNDCVPKITDFGLAKRLKEGDPGRTREGAILGTPSYMAPEQARGEAHAVGPAADVYALGAILYDLLTGGPPFRGPSTVDVLQQVIAADPLPPVHLQPRVPHDLQVICLKCLHKVPARRYASAGDLADDLRRFLAGEPIRARATPAWERLAKWARRRPAVTALVAVTAAAVLAVSGGAVLHARAEERLRQRAEDEAHRARAAQHGEARQRLRAEANFRDARDAVAELTQLGHRRLAHEPYMELVRRDLLEKSLAFQMRFLRVNGGAAGLGWEAARAWMRAGEIQTLLGDHPSAERSYRQALDRLAALREEAPDRPEYRRDQAAAWNDLGTLFQARRLPAGAAKAFDEAIALQVSLSAEFPGVPGYRRDLATTHNNRGTLRHIQGRLEGALADFRRARELFEHLAREHPLAALPRSGSRTPSAAEEAAAKYQEELARTHLRLAALRTGRDNPAAGRAARKALDLWRGLVERFPGVPRYQHERAATLLVRGTLHHLAGRSAEAERDYREAEAALSRLTAQFGSVPDYRLVLANVCRNRGQLLRQGNHPRQAEKVWRAAAAELTILAATFPNEPSYRQQLGSAYNEVGIALAMQNKARPAVAAWRDALAIQEPLVRQRPADAACWQDLIDTHTNLTAVLAGLSSAEALTSARALLAAQRRRLRAFPKEPAYRADLARACRTLAELLLRRADHAEAAAVIAELDNIAPCRRDLPGRVLPERAAELLAGCVAAAGKDVTLPESRRRQLAQKYGDRAMALLRRAAEQGYRDHRALADDRFSPLQERADFQALLRRLSS